MPIGVSVKAGESTGENFPAAGPGRL